MYEGNILNQCYFQFQRMHENREEGLSKFNTTCQSGEGLYPVTSPEGREVIRQELRELRELWESYSDGLQERDRRLDTQHAQWTVYEDRVAELQDWLQQVTVSLPDMELKNTLPEKKESAQMYKVGKELF